MSFAGESQRNGAATRVMETYATEDRRGHKSHSLTPWKRNPKPNTNFRDINSRPDHGLSATDRKFSPKASKKLEGIWFLDGYLDKFQSLSVRRASCFAAQPLVRGTR